MIGFNSELILSIFIGSLCLFNFSVLFSFSRTLFELLFFIFTIHSIFLFSNPAPWFLYVNSFITFKNSFYLNICHFVFNLYQIFFSSIPLFTFIFFSHYNLFLSLSLNKISPFKYFYLSIFYPFFPLHLVPVYLIQFLNIISFINIENTFFFLIYNTYFSVFLFHSNFLLFQSCFPSLFYSSISSVIVLKHYENFISLSTYKSIIVIFPYTAQGIDTTGRKKKKKKRSTHIINLELIQLQILIHLFCLWV